MSCIFYYIAPYNYNMFIVQGALQFKDKTKYQHKETNITPNRHSWRRKNKRSHITHYLKARKERKSNLSLCLNIDKVGVDLMYCGTYMRFVVRLGQLPETLYHPYVKS